MRTNPRNRFLASQASRLAVAMLASIAFCGGTLNAQTDGTWTANASGDWSNPANWAGGTVAGGAGSTADLSTVDITADHVVALDVPVTIGTLRLSDNGTLSNFWTIAGPQTLTLNNGVDQPVFNPLDRVNVVSASLAGTNGLNKRGGGAIVLSGDNSGLSGVLNLEVVTATGNDSGVFLDSDGAIGGITTINIGVGGSGNSGQFLALRGGRVLGPEVTVNLNSTGGSNAPPGGLRSQGAGAINVVQGPLNVTINGARIANHASAQRLDITGPITAGTNQVVFRFCDNQGIHITNPANSWTGPTIHSQGTLWFEPNALPANSHLTICASGAGTIQTSGTFSRTLGSDPGQLRVGSAEANMAGRAMGFGARGGDLTVNLGGAGAEVFFNNFTTDPNGTANTLNTSILVLNGGTADSKITLVNALNLNGTDRTIQASANVAEIAGAISGANRLDKTGAGVLLLSAANPWTGEFRINAGSNQNFGIARVTHSEAFGPPAAVKNIVLRGSNRTVAVVELAGNITIDANKTMRTSGKSYHDPSTAAQGDQVSLRNHSGNNAWLGDIIIAETGGAYGAESLAGGTLTLGADPATTKALYNDAANDTRGLSFFGGGDIVVNLKLATNPSNSARLLNIFKIGSGKLTIPRADNDFNQVPNLRSGVTEIVSLADSGSPSSLGTGTGFNLGATLRYTGTGHSSNRALGLLHTGGTLDSSGSGPLQLTGSGFSHQTGVGGTNSGPLVLDATSFTVNDPSSIIPGQTVTGTGIPAGTTVVSADVDTRLITISQPITTAAANGVNVAFGGQNNLDRTLTLTGDNAGDNLLAANLSNPSGTGKLGVTKTGAGKWTLSGTKTYTGPTAVTQGTLGISNAFPAGSALSVAPAATLALADVALTADPSTGLALDIEGTLNIAGPVNVALAQAAPAAGTYPVLKAGAITGTPTLITGSYRGASGSATGTTGSLTVGSGINLTWTGNTPGSEGLWDVTTTANWKDNVPSAQMFYYGDSVRFDDTSVESVVTMVGNLRPAAVTVATDFGYSFVGTGQLSGPFPLTKDGIGTLTISGTHSFSGGITVNAGTLRPGGNQSLGANGQVITIKDGATLDTNGVMNANRDYEAVIAGKGIDDLGAIVNSGGQHFNGFRKITLTADATIGGASRWDLRPAAGAGSFAAELDLGGFNLTKTGTNNIALVDATLSSDGGIAINEGMLSFTRMNVSGFGSVHVNSGAMLRLENYTAGSFTKAVHIQDGTLSVIGNNFTLGSPISLTGTATIDAAVNLTVSEPVSGTGSLVKNGNGLVTLFGANDYAGTTTVNTGSLVIGSQTTPGTLGAGEAITNANLVINRGDTSYVVANTISGTGAVTIGQNTGGSFDSLVTLTGTNTFGGNVNINSGGLKIFNAAALGNTPKTIQLTNGTAGRPQLYLDGSGGNITLPAGYSFLTSSTQQSHPAIGNLAGDNVIEGNFTLTSGGGNTAVVVLGGSLALNGGIAANVADRNLDLGGVSGANGTVNGTISNGTNPVGVRKLGDNTWTLTGPNTYTGATAVNAGTLMINGDQTAATGNVTVNSGATLGGGGILGGTIIANAGSTVAPGASIGTLTTTGALLNGNLAIEIDGGNADRFDVTGSLNISGATLAVSETGAGATEPVYIIGSYALLTGQFAAVTGVPAGYGIDYNYNGLKQIALVEGMLTPFQNWMNQFTALTSPADKLPGADPDGDGGNNLREFALNGDPANPAKNGYLAGRAAAVPGVGNAFVLTFAARAGTNFNGTATATFDGVKYTVRGSLDLQEFTAGVTEVVPPIVPAGWPAAGGGYQYHTFRLNASTGLPGKGFLRLELSE